MDKELKNAKQREYRQKIGDACTKKYEKTPKGYLMRKYRNMQSRILGIQKKNDYLYVGLELLSREDFYNWANSTSEFIDMFKVYEQSGYSMKLAPTVDRIDATRGYSIDNMRWLTHSENSRLGSLSKRRRTQIT